MLDYSKEKESMGEQVDPFDLTKKQEADLQRIRQFRLIDDVFMNKVFEDKSCVELLLQIILDRTDLHVESVNLQHGISNLQGRAVRLDILAVDDSGKIYNIEVQKNDHGAQAKRARYNSSLLDANITEAGNQYENLKETYVIFITENDVLRDNLPLYDIRRTIKQSAKDFEDGSHIIYVNSQRRDGTALGKLMQDLYCTDPKNLHYHEFAERMEFLKYSKEGEEKMTDVIEEYAARKAEALAKEAAEAMAKEKKIEFAKDLLAEGMSIEFTVRLSKLSEAEVRELASKLSA